MKIVKLVVLAAVLAASPACKKDPKKEDVSAKKDEPKKDEPKKDDMMKKDPATPDPGSAAVAPTPTPPPQEMKPAEDKADWIKVMATHVEANPKDPVVVKFEKFKVVKANFDPKKIEGGTATIEIDVTSLKTDDAKRDEHLATPDYIDVKKNAAITVDIGNVKKKDDTHFTADAKVKFRNIDKKYPVTFEVVEAKDDWIRVKGEHKFSRLDFKVGKKPGPDKKKDDGVNADLTIQMQLTLKKT